MAKLHPCGHYHIATHPQFILLKVHDKKSSDWFVSFVYGSPTTHLRRKLWEDMKLQNFHISGPWIVLGDFNCVLSANEVSNNHSFSYNNASSFAKWVFEEELLDLGFSGQTFTWMCGANPQSTKGARLDRALCNMEWRDRFPEATVMHLPIIGSDHCPVVVQMYAHKARNHNNSFRFQMEWLTHPKFGDMVKDHWTESNTLKDNNERLALALKVWNKNEFGNIFKKKHRLEAKITGIQ